MMQIHDWALAHRIPLSAVYDLLHRLGMGADSPQPVIKAGVSETAIQNNDRINAMQHGVLLWRNNVGALADDTGRFVRYGLCNDTEALNAKLKSSDGIGIKPVLITLEMVGQIIGQFVAREYKEAGWKFTGQGREEAQAAFIALVTSKGGDAAFASGVGSCARPDVVGLRQTIVLPSMVGQTVYIYSEGSK